LALLGCLSVSGTNKGKERNTQRENTVCVPAPLSGLYIPYLTVQYIRYVKLRTVTEL
jgi:hypothetical protein